MSKQMSKRLTLGTQAGYIKSECNEEATSNNCVAHLLPTVLGPGTSPYFQSTVCGPGGFSDLASDLAGDGDIAMTAKLSLIYRCFAGHCGSNGGLRTWHFRCSLVVLIFGT